MLELFRELLFGVADDFIDESLIPVSSLVLCGLRTRKAMSYVFATRVALSFRPFLTHVLFCWEFKILAKPLSEFIWSRELPLAARNLSRSSRA